jgi:hypothetical protein
LIANNYHIINKTSTVRWLCLLPPVSWYCVKVNVVCYPSRALHCSTRPSAQPFTHILCKVEIWFYNIILVCTRNEFPCRRAQHTRGAMRAAVQLVLEPKFGNITLYVCTWLQVRIWTLALWLLFLV